MSFIFKIMFMHLCECVCIHVHMCVYSQRPGEGTEIQAVVSQSAWQLTLESATPGLMLEQQQCFTMEPMSNHSVAFSLVFPTQYPLLLLLLLLYYYFEY